MLYLHETDLKRIGICWNETLDVIGTSIRLMYQNDFYQPLKPYVRFPDTANRIIAMPAYIGAPFDVAGIKWIASFPHNATRGLPRAHSVTILNDASTGKPFCIINTSLISAIRTASLSGYIISEFVNTGNRKGSFDIGIVGFGPIGQLHLEAAHAVLGSSIRRVYIYDHKEIDVATLPAELGKKIAICDNWHVPYTSADIFITATVSRTGYIEGKPRPGALLLNISLRDFKPEIMHCVDKMVVDNWEEVCRENTDIENMHKTFGLQKQETYSLVDFAARHPFEKLGGDEVVMFNPMGMAIFDIAIGGYYYRSAIEKKIGTMLQN